MVHASLLFFPRHWMTATDRDNPSREEALVDVFLHLVTPAFSSFYGLGARSWYSTVVQMGLLGACTRNY